MRDNALNYPSWVYQSEQEKGSNVVFCRRSDPVNLIFRQTSSIEADATFINAGWCNPRPFAHDQFLESNCTKKQDSQWAHTRFLWRRFHVRLWSHGSDLVGSAHYETLRFRGHEVHHFEGGEEKVADDFSDRGWQVTRRKHALNNRELVRYNDGFATEIQR